MTHLTDTYLDILERYRALWTTLTPSQLQAGRQWYPRAHQAAQMIGKRYGLNIDTVAGIIGALSPRARWSTNITMTLALLNGKRPGTFSHQIDKALDIRDGVPWDHVLTGPKETTFALSIIEPNQTDTPCVDSWIARINTPDDGGDAAIKRWTGKRILGEQHRAIKAMAAETGETMTATQACLWIGVRGTGD